MNMLKTVADYFISKAGKVPGLGYVFTALSLIAAIVLKKPEKDFDPIVVWIVWLLAFLFYFFSGILDDIIFDPQYEPDEKRKHRKGWGRTWRKCIRWCFYPVKHLLALLPKVAHLADTRRRAADKLNSEHKQCEGIYKSAVMLFEKSDEWDKSVKLWLDLSKMARAFIIPALVIFISDVLAESLGIAKMTAWLSYPIISWFSCWVVALSMFVALLVLYTLFRILHMASLYEIILKSDISEVCPLNKEKYCEIPLLIVGKIIIPKHVLPIFHHPSTSENASNSGNLSGHVQQSENNR